MAALTSEQKSFLEECEVEFSDRYTIADPDFEKIHETGVPAPPIVFPWYGRSRHNNRDGNRGEFNRNQDDRRSDNRGYHEDRRSENRGNYDDRRFDNKRNYEYRKSDNRGNYNRNRGYRGDGPY